MPSDKIMENKRIPNLHDGIDQDKNKVSPFFGFPKVVKRIEMRQEVKDKKVFNENISVFIIVRDIRILKNKYFNQLENWQGEEDVIRNIKIFILFI